MALESGRQGMLAEQKDQREGEGKRHEWPTDIGLYRVAAEWAGYIRSWWRRCGGWRRSFDRLNTKINFAHEVASVAEIDGCTIWEIYSHLRARSSVVAGITEHYFGSVFP